MEKFTLFLEEIADPVLWPTLIFMAILVLVLLCVYFFRHDEWTKHF
jgi:hypothetical protein